MKEKIPQILFGGGKLSTRARIQCIVKSTFSETHLVPALNDILIANPSPAAVSRFRMGWLKEVIEPPTPLRDGGGGSGLTGMPHKAYVVYPNGRAQQSLHVGRLVYQRPKVVPGSTIVVPEKDQASGFTVDPQVAAVYTAVLSAISTATIGIITLLRP